MATKTKRKPAATPKQLQTTVDAIKPFDVEPVAPSAPRVTAQPPTSARAAEQYAAASEPFGSWLVKQKGEDGLVGRLAAGVAADRGFPRDGDPDLLRARLHALGAEGDMFEAVDDAELAWLAH
jgi:hypothetical protein